MKGTYIRLGMRVALQDEEGQVWWVELVHVDQIDPEHNKISIASPAGRALLGHKAGEEVTVRTPAGEMRYRILEVTPIAQATISAAGAHTARGGKRSARLRPVLTDGKRGDRGGDLA